MHGDLLAWDVRVRVGYGQHLPFWRGALRPDPRAARLAAGHSDRPVPF